MDERLRDTVAASFLAKLPADAVEPLLAEAHRFEVAAGTRICDDSGDPHIILTERGLIRMARVAADGRTVTQRYLRHGDFGGIPAYFSGGTLSGACFAIVDSAYYLMRDEAWRDTARRDARVAFALLEEVSRIMVASVHQLADGSLASVRQRVARELLDIAADRQAGAALVAPVTQQQLADGLGSAREVVARALRELRESGSVETGQGGIVILDAQALRAQFEAIA